jgi:hypothetical protein
MGLQRHPRAQITALAHNELDKMVIDLIGKHKLTYGELQSILAQIQLAWAGWQIKDERETP